MRKSIIRTAIMVVAFVFFGSMNVHAQSWDDMTTWFRHSGVEILAVYAHPMLDMTDYSIVEVNSSSIVVKMHFEGKRRSFTSKYQIVKGTYNGRPYFKTVSILDDDLFRTSFVTWSAAPKLHSTAYNNMGASAMYGAYSFDDLSINQQAAFGLQMEFINAY